MILLCRYYFLYIFLLSLMVSIINGEFSADDCKKLGFNKANLLCSTCDKFNKYNVPEIYDKCKECCLKDDDYDASGFKRYPKAILKVCTCKFGAYPQIQAFIKSDRPSKYKNLQIRYVRGLDPIIKLLDADNKVEDILDIHKWDTDSIDEFLATHLATD
ncbi:PREDICTED: 15 kDa selenoprotein [Polistes canadensis]|uniref:15 kDa selenoprotein n=1 Tax=Polistes canadensis TaxID=91411 RepID=UPI000718C9E0|nr:PREDICTED: 15 kDa selenoprotein [Polistes canadensis]